MQWGVQSFAYSCKKLNNIIDCICDTMLVSMFPSVELEVGGKMFLGSLLTSV